MEYLRMRKHTNSQPSARATGRSRRRFISAAGATALAGLAGCTGGGGSDGDSGGDASSGTTTGTEDTTPPKPDSITVRAWGGAWQENLDKHIAQAFTDETGIEVEYDNSTEEEMQGKIRTAITQDRTPPVNVNWSLSKTSYRSYQMGLMEPLDTEVAPNLEGLLGASKPEVEDAEWPFVNLYSYTYALTYNTDLVSSEPTSWSVWWDDEWENSIGLYPGGHGITPLIAKMTGTELGPVEEMTPVWDEYTALKPNVGTIGDDSHLTQNLRQGEVAMSVMLPANIINAQDDGAPVDYTIPEEGARAGRDTMWTPTNQDERYVYWGQKFIDTAANAENLGPWSTELGVAPLHADATIPDWMRDSVAFPTSEEQFNQMITVPLDLLIEHQAAWESRVNEMMQA
ncbi:extracellular solute-binding protein [Haloferax sulfurifontis]|uniref:ABC transporter substrate-binding protein n=2 Tax=Haloferax sulfurifontis TaxID=255616 RepID=A0A830E7U2_9EURY|nr:extracellular solute-binding protein [Haloferax sulfurifontis]GGC50717.1 ABC transporter substrate-binding protein [Haloferax sulfurifontis]